MPAAVICVARVFSLEVVPTQLPHGLADYLLSYGRGEISLSLTWAGLNDRPVASDGNALSGLSCDRAACSYTARKLTRRAMITAVAAGALKAARPNGPVVDTHVHLFANDQKRFPYHPNATYKPPPQDVEPYAKFVHEARIDHAIIVHPEPYQDDHSYLEYCFANEPSRGFFKGTCLFDPIAADTPKRIEALVKKYPGRIVALRIHANRKAGTPPTTSGSIRDRDLRHPAMKQTWRAATDLGLAIQMHFIPYHAPQIGELASAFAKTIVILDHLGRAGEGTAAEYDDVLRLAKLPRVMMKFSGVSYSSKQPHPHTDARPLVRKTVDAFSADRIIWGGVGMNAEEFDKAVALFDHMFAFLAESDRAKIRGGNAMKLFGWSL
jgi:predicted TIM-barrel fold metal-dependent hydrolase